MADGVVSSVLSSSVVLFYQLGSGCDSSTGSVDAASVSACDLKKCFLFFGFHVDRRDDNRRDRGHLST